MNETSQPLRIAGLEQLLREAASRGDAPVERWNPPYCGDIGLAIKSDGSWTYRESPINRPALVKLFSRVLRKDDDGRTYLVTPAEKIDVAVADAPFLAVEMETQGEGKSQTLTLRTNVDDIVIAGPNHPISFVIEPETGGLKPYVLVRGRLMALLSRPLTFDLADLLQPESGAGSALGLWSNGAFFPVPRE